MLMVFACQFDQNTVEPKTVAAEEKRKKNRAHFNPRLLTAAEYIPLC